MKKLIAMALVAFAIASCSKENTSVDPNLAQGESTYAGVTISFPTSVTTPVAQSATRADANANAMETAVKSIGVYVADKVSELVHCGLYSASDFQLVGEKYQLKTALLTTSGAKTFYVVLNPSTQLHAKIVAAGKNSFNGSLALVDETFINKKSNAIESLTMSSLSGGKEYTVAVQDKDAALANPFAVVVERNTAKVTVKFASSYDVIGGSVSSMKFGVGVVPKQSYLIQNLIDPAQPVSITNVYTPANKVTMPDAAKASAEYIAYIAKYFSANVVLPAEWIDVQAATVANNALLGFYCPENVNKKDLQENTTSAIIKAVFTPTAGTAVTAYNAGTKETTLGDITTGSSFYKRKSDGVLWSDAAYNAATSSSDMTSDAFSAKYDGGVCYYRIWVMGENATGPGEVGVLRNKFYVLNITKINGIGTPAHPSTGSTPGEEIETQCLISVDVTLTDWSMVESNHEI
ncbi:MAG: Mfa1 family fimbria major subunit [Alistipes sp.]